MRIGVLEVVPRRGVLRADDEPLTQASSKTLCVTCTGTGRTSTGGSNAFWSPPGDHWSTPTLIVVDEAQEMTQKRQQSKLKTLPPRPDLTLVFCTTEPEAIEASIRDRCAKIKLGPLAARELPLLVKRACEARGIQYTTELVQAMNRSNCFRPRAILNAVDALARGKSIAQAVAGQAA
jgi:DNA polymerase III delta prime subunit